MAEGIAAHITQKRLDRWWGRVDKNGPLPEEREWLGPCWLWGGHVRKDGYGAISLMAKTRYAHRVFWAIEHGDPAPGAFIDHLCMVRHCVNVSHMREADRVTNGQNRSGKHPTSTSGHRGVAWISSRRAWRCKGVVDGEMRILKQFPEDSLDKAIEFMADWHRRNYPGHVEEPR